MIRAGCFCSVSVCAWGARSVSAQQRTLSRAGWISDESCGTNTRIPGRGLACRNAWVEGFGGHPEWKPQRPSL